MIWKWIDRLLHNFSSPIPVHDTAHWNAMVSADRQRISDLFLHWSKIHDKTNILRVAIRSVNQRDTALGLLLLVDDEIRQSVFDELVDLASVGHSDIQLCWDVIRIMPRKWVIDHIMTTINSVLDANPNDDESFRRYAELLEELDRDCCVNLSDGQGSLQTRTSRKSPTITQKGDRE